MGVKILIIFLLNLLFMPTDEKITQLDVASTLVNANELAIVQGGNTNRVLLRDDTGVRASLDDFVNPCTLRCAQLTIVTGSVLTLFATPITIVAAPGAGLAIEVVSATAELQFNAAAYTTNGTLVLITATAIGAQMRWLPNTFLFGTVSRIVLGEVFHTVAITNTQIIANQALNVSVLVGNPAVGDSPIIVRVMYRLISV